MPDEELHRRVSVLEREFTENRREFIENRVILREHLKSCDRRGARLERLSWAAASGIAAILVMIVRAYFHLGGN